MDSTSAPHASGAAAFAFQNWTLIALIVIAILAALVVAGMLWGQKKARERHRVEDAAAERAQEPGTELPTAPAPSSMDAGSGVPPEQPRPTPEPTPTPEPLAARELAPEPVPEEAVEPVPVAPPETMIEPPAEPEPAEPEPEVAVAPEPPVAAEPAAAPQPDTLALAPESVPAPTPAPAPANEPEPSGAMALTTIKGLGPKVAAMLAERGFTRVDQIAALSPDEASALDIQLGAFTGRMARDRWIEQAKLLAAGDTAAYEAAFGKLG